MPDKPWKVMERVVADLFGVKRNPLSGGNSRHSRSDSLHDELFIECKYSARSSLWTLFDDAKDKAKKEDKIPVIAIKKKGKSGSLIAIHSDDVEVVLRMLRKARNAKAEVTRKKME